MAKLFVNNGLHAEQVHKRVDFVVDIPSLQSSNAGEHPYNLATSQVFKHRVELRTVADLLVYLECDTSCIRHQELHGVTHVAANMFNLRTILV